MGPPLQGGPNATPDLFTDIQAAVCHAGWNSDRHISPTLPTNKSGAHWVGLGPNLKTTVNRIGGGRWGFPGPGGISSLAWEQVYSPKPE